MTGLRPIRTWKVRSGSVSTACRSKALMALVYLQWASPALIRKMTKPRWEKAAQYAAEVMDFKLKQDGAHGFDPMAGFDWTDPNSPEIIWSSAQVKGSTLEKLFYPGGFLGSGALGPTQELVDAFPMANGYPIDHELGITTRAIRMRTGIRAFTRPFIATVPRSGVLRMTR